MIKINNFKFLKDLGFFFYYFYCCLKSIVFFYFQIMEFNCSTLKNKINCLNRSPTHKQTIVKALNCIIGK